MTGINRVVLVGRMTADPQLRKTNSNMSVASFSLAIDRRMGQGKEAQADFINCVAWNKTAENTAQYMHKGSLVGIEGRIQTRKYVDKQGNNRIATEVVAEIVTFLDTKGSSANRPSTNAPVSTPTDIDPDYSNDEMPTDAASLDISADDLPF